MKKDTLDFIDLDQTTEWDRLEVETEVSDLQQEDSAIEIVDLDQEVLMEKQDSEIPVREHKTKRSSEKQPVKKKVPKSGNTSKKKQNKPVNFFKEMTMLDGLVAATGTLVLVVAIVTVSVFSNAKIVEKQLQSFVPLGEEMAYLVDGGNATLLAMADAKKAVEITEEIEEEKEEEKEDEEKSIQVNMKLSSIQKDLKIKFVNQKTGKLVSGVPFKVSIKGGKGNTIEKEDQDKDGIIYLTNMAPGDISVTPLAVMFGEKKIALNTAEQTIFIKKNIEYKKVDVADEVKTENEVNAAEEDTAEKTKEEGSLKDTIEWVASSREPVNASTGYEKVDKGSISEPSKQVRAYFEAGFERNLYENMSFLAEVKTITTTEENTTTTEEQTTTTEEHTTTTEESSSSESQECEHDFKLKECTATCTKDGKNIYVCTKCKILKEEDVKALGHNMKDGKCTRCGELEKKPEPSKPAYDPKTDTSSKLKDNSGKTLYVLKDGNYAEATYADYFNYNEFYRRVENVEYRYTGWQTLDGKTYFFDKNGNKVTGEQVIQGAKYNFGSDGSIVTGSGTLGIDVSKWNGNINWDAVKSSGVSYVIIRCGYRGSTTGSLIEDPKFKQNIQGASKAGLKIGIYFFTQAMNEVEAVEEASMTINLIKNYSISYPVFLDVEASHGRADAIDPATRTQVIKAYCETIRNSGYTAGVYANKTWLNSYMHAGELNKYKIWLAQYNSTVTYGGKYDLWQYSSKGSVNGIGGRTDMNLSYLGY